MCGVSVRCCSLVRVPGSLGLRAGDVLEHVVPATDQSLLLAITPQVRTHTTHTG